MDRSEQRSLEISTFNDDLWPSLVLKIRQDWLTVSRHFLFLIREVSIFAAFERHFFDSPSLA